MKLLRDVALIGAGMTRFHNKIHVDKTSREIFIEAALEAVDSVDKNFGIKDVDALFLGTFSGDAFENQAHMAALMVDWLGINPKPAIRIEDACASSGVAINVGSMAIASGLYDIIMVGGVEKMTNLDTFRVTDTLAMAADNLFEVSIGFTFPGLYASMATAYFAKYGSKWDHLAAVSIKNHYNGSLNPKAHFQSSILEMAKNIGKSRGLTFNDEMEFLRSPLNPVIAYPLRLFDCCPISDGAAVLILAEAKKARKFTDTPIFLRGIGQSSDTMCLSNREDLTSLKATKIAARQAYKMAGVKSKDIDVAVVHDCFTIAEILATEDLGFFPKGRGGVAAEEGRTAISGDKPINPDGGLKAKGHPVGATGAAMAYEIFKQLRGEAGKHQIPDAEVGLSHNVGASGATVTVQIYGR
ncbi:MAG: thiolase domain-containing protein [Candidatus Bathyarchaeia archaeon]